MGAGRDGWQVKGINTSGKKFKLTSPYGFRYVLFSVVRLVLWVWGLVFGLVFFGLNEVFFEEDLVYTGRWFCFSHVRKQFSCFNDRASKKPSGRSNI